MVNEALWINTTLIYVQSIINLMDNEYVKNGIAPKKYAHIFIRYESRSIENNYGVRCIT